MIVPRTRTHTTPTPMPPTSCRRWSSRPDGAAATAAAGPAAASAGSSSSSCSRSCWPRSSWSWPLTALRPVVNRTILSWAADNPAALSMPFVKDIVREDLGASLTQPASSDPSQVEFVVQDGDTASTIATRLERDGLIRDDRAFVFYAVERKLTDKLQQGTFLLRKNLAPERPGHGAARSAGHPVRGSRPADRPPARADHGQAPDAARCRWTSRSSTTSRRRRRRSSSTTTRG